MSHISVIIPCFQQAQYLGEAIDSALDQTVPAKEIIVVNDGSFDEIKKVLDIYGDTIKVVHQTNRGLASARNTGIMNATGEYVLPLDADDQLLPNCIEKLEQAIETHSPDVIAPSFRTFGNISQDVILNQLPTVRDFLSANRLGYFSAVKRSVLASIGGYSPRMVWGWEDWALWVDIFKRGHSLCLLSDILVLYRVKSESMIVDANKHWYELSMQMRKDHPDLPWPPIRA